MKRAATWTKETVTVGLDAGHSVSIRTWSAVEDELTRESQDLEAYFKEKGVGMPQNWFFSTENLTCIKEIGSFIGKNTADCSQLGVTAMGKYLIAYAIVQSLSRQQHWDLPLTPSPPAFSLLLDMRLFCKYSIGIYGKTLVNCYMQGRTLDAFARIHDTDALCEYTNVDRSQVVRAHFESSHLL